jgi:hypothetical protein
MSPPYPPTTKVAMAIYTTVEPESDENNRSHFTSDTLRKCFGYAEHINIYTGEIVGVYENHIEHNINTYSGFSGAAIFLLDNPTLQHQSVKKEDYGKVIAIHVGCAQNLEDVNIALKIGRVPGKWSALLARLRFW